MADFRKPICGVSGTGQTWRTDLCRMPGKKLQPSRQTLSAPRAAALTDSIRKEDRQDLSLSTVYHVYHAAISIGACQAFDAA